MSLNKVEDKVRGLLKRDPSLINQSNTIMCFSFWNEFEGNQLRLFQWESLTPAESITRCLRKIKNNPLNKIEEQIKYREYSKQ